jgi:hypothetical protein
LNLYHYLFKDNPIDFDHLLPADYIQPSQKKYYREGLSPKQYMVKIYDEYYKPTLQLPYNNYGIYLTSVDLFAFDSKPNRRIIFDSEEIISMKLVVIGIGKDVEMLTSTSQIEKLMEGFDNEKVERLYNSSKLIFTHLPQIVVFDGKLNFNRGQIERR